MCVRKLDNKQEHEIRIRSFLITILYNHVLTLKESSRGGERDDVERSKGKHREAGPSLIVLD